MVAKPKPIDTIADLTPDARNPRKRGQRAAGMLVNSLHEVGAARSIVIDEAGNILAGNGTVEAAAEAGIERVQVVDVDGETLVAVRRSGLTAKQKRRLAILDNRTGELAEWDVGVLAEIAQAGVEIDDLWSTDELSAMLAGMEHGDGGLLPGVDADAIPEDAPTRCNTGDLWRMGDHRLLCGDCTDRATVEWLMGGDLAQLVFTSPPYLQQREYGPRAQEHVQDWDVLMDGAFSAASTSHECQMFVNLGMIHSGGEWNPYWYGWMDRMRAAGWKRFGWYIWHQGPGMPGDANGRFASSFEHVFHFNRVAIDPHKIVECTHAGAIHGGTGQRNAAGVVKSYSHAGRPISAMKVHDNVICVNRACGRDGHPAAFPVALPDVFLRSWDGLVYDPFLGSGTTLMAAEQLGRACCGMEIEPRYCDIVLTRWENATGRTAERLDA